MKFFWKEILQEIKLAYIIIKVKSTRNFKHESKAKNLNFVKRLRKIKGRTFLWYIYLNYYQNHFSFPSHIFWNFLLFFKNYLKHFWLFLLIDYAQNFQLYYLIIHNETRAQAKNLIISLRIGAREKIKNWDTKKRGNCVWKAHFYYFVVAVISD